MGSPAGRPAGQNFYGEARYVGTLHTFRKDKGRNKVDVPRILLEMYASGMSLTEVCTSPEGRGYSISTLRYRLIDAGLLRTHLSSVRLAASQGKLGHPGVKRVEFSKRWRDAISRARLAHAEKNAKTLSKKPNGYIEFTRGPHKGRMQHDIIMEQSIGRRLQSGEIVHHINEIRSDNRIENLQLMTRSEHSRHHAMKKLPHRARRENGQWQKASVA